MVFADFNPDMKFWLHDEIIPEQDTDFIILTHEDNEYLPDKERSEIYKYKEKGFFNPDEKDLFSQDNIKSKYWSNKWLVYGLGRPGKLEGIIFDNWEILERVPPNAGYQGSGLDFGFSVDPTTIIDNYLYNQKRIWDEHLYTAGLTNPEIARQAKQGMSRLIYADSAEPKSIEEIRRHGIRILGADKGKDSINFGIDLLQQDKFYVTKRSVHLIEELQSYTWATDRHGKFTGAPVDNFNHCIDGMRYFAIMKMKTGSGRYSVSVR
jgi:phage terminase large subunit